MNYKRTSIVILTHEVNRDVLREVLAGVEEEGCLYEVAESNSNLSADELAAKASMQSALSVGIGIVRNEVALSFRTQIDEGLIDFGPLLCRKLGQNAARYIKHKYFILE